MGDTDSVCKTCAKYRCDNCVVEGQDTDLPCKICMNQECPYCYNMGKGEYDNRIYITEAGEIKKVKNWTLLILFSTLAIISLFLLIRKLRR